MRYSRVKNETSSVALFPFLAVLMCTMGALIVVLVVFSHQARVQAASEIAAKKHTHDAEAATLEASQREQREDLEWQVEQFQTVYQATNNDLEQNRLLLSHLEDHYRRLRAEKDQLLAAIQAMEQSENHTAQQQAANAARLAQLRQEIIRASEELTTVSAAKKALKPAYCIIPYEGPNGTSQRPLYIECRADAVVLQPEGIVLDPNDFEEPLGPGNPLASAVRAAREYLVSKKTGPLKPEDEPYPLLLVRPDGVVAYYKARAALESWGSNFGYELVGDDWKLEFPQPDKKLAEIEREAVDAGRVNQMRLAAAAPGKYGRRGPTYRASPHRGGFIREEGTGGRSSDSFGKSDGKSGSTSSPPPRGSADSATPPPPSGDPNQTPPGGKGPQTAKDSAQQKGQPGGASGSPKEASPWEAGQAVASIAGKRGADWALPDANKRAVPITRPIKLICRGDRIVILAEKGEAGGKVIMLPPRTEDSVDELVSALWEHMQAWGIAGNGLYWRPILQMQVGPEGYGRAHDFEHLLDRSGMEVRITNPVKP